MINVLGAISNLYKRVVGGLNGQEQPETKDESIPFNAMDLDGLVGKELCLVVYAPSTKSLSLYPIAELNLLRPLLESLKDSGALMEVVSRSPHNMATYMLDEQIERITDGQGQRIKGISSMQFYMFTLGNVEYNIANGAPILNGQAAEYCACTDQVAAESKSMKIYMSKMPITKTKGLIV